MKLTPSSTARRNTRMTVMILRRAPYALTGYPHGPESESVDGEVATDGEGPRCMIGG